MAESSALIRLKGLVLSAAELQALTNWPDALVEDYLTLFDNLVDIATSLDTGGAVSIQTINADYTTTGNDGAILVNANGAAVTVKLQFGNLEGQEHSIKVIDNTYPVYVDPNGNELDGSTDTFEMFLDESIRVKSDNSKNWWVL